jgi:hypothetical protein
LKYRVISLLKGIRAVEGPYLAEVTMFMAIELNNLGVPVFVVDLSPSDFDSFSFPSGNLGEHFPAFSEVRFLKISIFSKIKRGSFPDKLDVIDSEAIAIGNTGAFELDVVISDNSLDWDSLAVNVVVAGSDIGDFLAIPENFALTRVEGNILSAGIVERNNEFVGFSGSGFANHWRRCNEWRGNERRSDFYLFGDHIELFVEVPDLSHENLFSLMAIELNDLRSPVFVVDLSPSDLNSFPFPSGNLGEHIPAFS